MLYFLAVLYLEPQGLRVMKLIQLPKKSLNLLNETNGVFDKFDCPLIWSTGKIIEDNLFFRNFDDYKDIYMPFDNLMFFSDGGNGDLFGFAILNGSIQKEDIYVWNHEDDSRTWIASSLTVHKRLDYFRNFYINRRFRS